MEEGGVGVAGGEEAHGRVLAPALPRRAQRLAQMLDNMFLLQKFAQKCLTKKSLELGQCVKLECQVNGTSGHHLNNP